MINSCSEMNCIECLSPTSVKVIAGSIMRGVIADNAAKELADDVSFKLKCLVQDAAKFMHHEKRRKLSCLDIDHAIKVRNIEPLYGYGVKASTPFRSARWGENQLYFTEEKEELLSEVIRTTKPRIPIQVSLTSHCHVDAVQPIVTETHPHLSKEPVSQNTACKPKFETVHVKQLTVHPLPLEKQMLYIAITEACVGTDEMKRVQALRFLSTYPGLYEMLPQLSIFIFEGVKVNVVQTNLAHLIYLIRMVNAMIDHPCLFLKKYLHEIVPAVVTCIVSKQLCMRPEVENHWSLRDYASQSIKRICINFDNSTISLQTKLTRLFCGGLHRSNTSLSSLYGCIAGLCELGTDTIKMYVMPRLKYINSKIQAESSTDKIAASHVKDIILKKCIFK